MWGPTLQLVCNLPVISVWRVYKLPYNHIWTAFSWNTFTESSHSIIPVFHKYFETALLSPPFPHSRTVFFSPCIIISPRLLLQHLDVLIIFLFIYLQFLLNYSLGLLQLAFATAINSEKLIPSCYMKPTISLPLPR